MLKNVKQLKTYKTLVVPGQRLDRPCAKIKFLKIWVLLHFVIKYNKLVCQMSRYSVPKNSAFDWQSFRFQLKKFANIWRNKRDKIILIVEVWRAKRASGAPWVRKCGKLPIPENLVTVHRPTARPPARPSARPTVRPHHRYTKVYSHTF